jgi:hypothetical protein
MAIQAVMTVHSRSRGCGSSAGPWMRTIAVIAGVILECAARRIERETVDHRRSRGFGPTLAGTIVAR